MDSDVKIGKADIEELMNESGESVKEPPKKHKRTGGEIALIAVCVLVMVIYYGFLAFGKYIMSEDSTFYQSVNVFSGAEETNPVLRIISYVILIFSLSYLLRLLMSMLAESKTLTHFTGVAIIKLAGTVVKFLAPLILLVIILSTLGVQTTEIIAGLGVLSLILGLGVSSMVEDIVAGMFIIAERTFDVGDWITINGFYGKVKSIGIRSTQIEDKGGDILIMRNSKVGSLVNMTANLSVAFCEFDVSPEVEIEYLENLIKGASKEMQQKIPDIKAGPIYYGLTRLDAHTMHIAVIAQCEESRRSSVKRKMLKEYKILFEKNHIPLGYTL